MTTKRKPKMTVTGDAWDRPRNRAEKRAEALDLLDITEADILSIPKIEPLLEQACILEKVWDYLFLGREYDAAKKVLVKYEMLRAVKLHTFVPFEAYCVASKTPTLDVLTVLSKVMKSHVDLLSNSKKLGALHENSGASSSGRAAVAVLPAIEDDIRTVSDKFNDEQARRAPAPEEGEYGDEEEENQDDQD